MSITNNKYIGSWTGYSTLSTGEKKNALNAYQRAWEEEQRKQQEKAHQEALARQAQIEEEKKNRGGLLGGIGYTLEKLGLGVVRSIEGISDYIVGGIADLFGADDYADEVLKNDWVNYEHADEWYNPGKGWEFVGDVAGGIGGMLPSIALTAATGGTSALAQGLGTAAFGLGAAGQSVSEQTKKSGTATGKEWLYGTASGAAEAAIERVSGGIGGMASGTVLGKQLAKTTGGKIATSFIGEGLEEVASDLLDPALKRVTGVDKKATVDWANLPRTFLVGGTTGAVMGAGKRTIDAAKVGGFNNLNAGETAQTLDERMSENNIRQAKGKSVRYNETDMVDTKSRLSDYLQRMDEPTRQTFLQSNKRIAHLFNADGTVAENTALRTDISPTTNKNVSSEQSTENKNRLNLGSYSASLRGSENTFAYAPVNEDVKISEPVAEVMKNIELMTDGKADIVLTADDFGTTANGRKINGVYQNGILYLNANATTAEQTMTIASHEVMHTLEGTKEYAELGNFIDDRIKNNTELSKKYNLAEYLERYDNAHAGKEYSEQTKLYEAKTEMYADFVANEVLSNETVVRNLVAKNRNVVVRILNWVRGAIKRISASKTERAEYKTLKQAERLLSSALEAGRGGVTLDEVERSVQERKTLEETDNKAQNITFEKAEGVPLEARYSVEKTPTTQRQTVRVYSDTDVKNVVDNSVKAFNDFLGAEDYNISIKGKNKIIDEYKALLNKNISTRTDLNKISSDLAEKIANNLSIEKIDYGDITEAKAIVESLKPYYHSMNLSSVKSEILDSADYKLFSGGKNALPWNSVLMEITEKYPQFLKENVGNTDIDTLLNVFADYRKAREVLDSVKALPEELTGDFAEVKSIIQKYIYNSLSENGTLYKSNNVTPKYMTEEEYKKKLQKKSSVSTDEQKAKVLTVLTPKEKLSKEQKKQELKDKAVNKSIELQIETTNAQAGIEHEGRRLGQKRIESKTQKARSATAASTSMLSDRQWNYARTEVVGESLNDIFSPVFEKGEQYTIDFYEYLLHWHNVDRMNLEKNAQNEIRQLLNNDAELNKIVKQKNITETERKKRLNKTENGRTYLRLLEVKNKPVFGESETAADSQKAKQELQAKHPEFAKLAQKVWNYNKNLLQWRVDAGLVTQEYADRLNKMYPHYVPTFRNVENGGAARGGATVGRNTVEVKKTIKSAKGSNLDILDLSLMMSNQTLAVFRAEAINDIANTLYEGAINNQDFTNVEVMSVEKLEDINLEDKDDISYNEDKPKEGKVIFYKNGERITLNVSKPIAVGFEAYSSADSLNSPLVKMSEKINNVFKKTVTQWNPLFLGSNFIRDLQEAIFYTKNGIGKFIASMPKAIKIMAKKGELWQKYLSVGGIASGYFNSETGIYDRSGKAKKAYKKVIGTLSFVNEFVEQIPRFTEFMLSVENGKTYEQALLDSAEVTTNFSRGGTLTKTLNRTLIPFLNPSVQGWSKLWRTATGRKTGKEWMTLIVKATLVGLSVGLINDLINGDDEEYKNLSMRDKENYYLIKIGDKFLKLPKGRVVAALGSVATRVKEYADGNENAFKDWGSSVSQMVSPVESATRTIFSPILTDVRTNTTWYGGKIESQALQNYAPSERYDESTSSIAIAIGKVFNYSPKKVHYLLDQYTGVFGDVLLPLTSKKAERDPISNRFVLDPVVQNGIATEFYDELDELKFAKNAGEAEAVLSYRYLNSVSSTVSDMYQQKRDIENSNLSDKEKREQTRVIQAAINELLSSSLESVEQFENSVIGSNYSMEVNTLLNNATYKTFTESQQTRAAQKLTDYYYDKTMSDITGKKHDTKYYLYDALGSVNASVYLTEISAIESDKDKNGKTVPNSRKNKVHAYVQKLRLTALQKYILMTLAGYVPTELGKTQVERYLRSKGLTAKESKEIWD